MSTTTNLTIALRMAEWMSINRIPFPNNYEIQPNFTMPPNDLVADCYNAPANAPWLDQPAVDASHFGGTGNQLINGDYIAAGLVGIGFLVQSGVTLATITGAINSNPYMVLSSLYTPSPSYMAPYLEVASQQVAIALAPTNGKFQDDFFGAFGVVYPQPPTIEQQIVAVCANAFNVSPTTAQTAQAVAEVTSLLSTI